MPRVLFLTAYPEEDASCRYRVHQFVPCLERAGYSCTVASFASEKLFRLLRSRGGLIAKALEMARRSARRIAILRQVDSYDFVVIHREAFPFFAPTIESLVLRQAWRSRQHTKVIFSFDDAIYAGHEDVSTLNHPRLYRLKHGRGYDEVVRRCDHVIAGNRILAQYANKLNPAVTVIPTVVDCTKHLARDSHADSSSPLIIGWMGSPTTAPYLRIIEGALRRIAAEHAGNVQFRFIGCPEYKPSVRSAESKPFQLESEIRDLQQFDIGLMPLPDNPWTQGKCAFKAIQYMACGVATVASPVGITPDLIRDGVNGFLASSEEDWFTRLDQLVTNPALRMQIAREGRRTVETSYSLGVWGPRMVALFDQLGSSRSILEHDTIAA